MTRAELLEHTSSRELTEWMLFYELEPFGTDINFMGHAITASTIANVNRKKHGKAYEPKDFMPKFERKKQEESVSQAIAFAEIFTMTHGGKDKRE